MTTWAVILAVGAGSFLFRVAPLLLLQRAILSETADRTIRHAGQAAIAGLIAISVRHAAHGSSIVPTMLAVTFGMSLAVRGGSMLRIIGSGGAIYAVSLVVLEVVG